MGLLVVTSALNCVVLFATYTFHFCTSLLSPVASALPAVPLNLQLFL
jgi:hypothetical protein